MTNPWICPKCGEDLEAWSEDYSDGGTAYIAELRCPAGCDQLRRGDAPVVVSGGRGAHELPELTLESRGVFHGALDALHEQACVDSSRIRDVHGLAVDIHVVLLVGEVHELYSYLHSWKKVWVFLRLGKKQ